MIFNEGAKVVDANGATVGTVRETLPDYLHLKVKENALTDVELYLPRDMVARAEHDHIYLNRTLDELKGMNLTTPPALR
jgi:hypothetical protein